MPINPLLSSALPRPQIKVPVDGIYINDGVGSFDNKPSK